MINQINYLNIKETIWYISWL